MQSGKRELFLLPMRPSPVAGPAPTDRADVQIYRPFFLAGIATVLTVGCLLGAIALLGIAQQGSYISGAWTPYVLAHANSQLFGWVGFFVMGFAMQQHGTSHERLGSFRRVAMAALVSMGIGIGLRFVAEPLVLSDPATGRALGVFSGLFQIAAVLLFAYNTGVNRYRKSEPMRWPTAFVFASLGCLLLVSLAEPYVFLMTHQADRLASLAFVARWMTPVREVQFLGFVALMIFGVAASKFPGCLGFRPAHAGLGLTALVCWLGGLGLRVFGWGHYFAANMTPASDMAYRAGAVLLWAGAVFMTASLGVFATRRETNASQKFIRAAFAWLLVAGGMLVAEPIHLAAIGAPFSHAYTGAIRHAVTVGFISQMIIAVGYHLATRMRMMDERAVAPLWPVFVLLNVGNAGRVGLELATDYTANAFVPMGFTGFVELIGLSIWAVAMVRLIAGRNHVYATTC